MRTPDVFGKGIFAGAIATALLALPGTAYARGFTVLYSFGNQNNYAGGADPNVIIRDSAGNIYGTTRQGGGVIDRGVIFKIAPDDSETVLYTFCSNNGCTDGAYPSDGVIEDSAGNLYGTTWGGGANSDSGTVFELAPDGTETVLYSFCSVNYCLDGEAPTSGLVRDAAGNLYGVTAYGGTYAGGVAFKIAPDGAETVLHNFGDLDGSYPLGSLIDDSQGNFYGTTVMGGAHDAGVVFKLAPDGSETVLYDFCRKRKCADGVGPSGDLVQDADGNLYGTTQYGGGGTCDGGATCGVIFKIAPDGRETVLHEFGNVDGAFPNGGLVRDRAGNLYGTTFSGGVGCQYSLCGTVFRLAPDGTETVLHSFKDGNDGKWPGAGLIEDRSGYLYGTTLVGDFNKDAGAVFRIRK